MTVTQAPRGALEGIVIVDFTHGEAAAAASFALAQFGARVFLVEPPTGMALRQEAQKLPEGEALLAGWHANKNSFTVDLESAAGCEQVKALIQRADILLEDSEAEMARLGLDFMTAHALNPSLVYGSVRPWAAPKEFNGLASEVLLQAITGVMAQTGYEDGRPLRTGGHYISGLSGLYFASGLLAGLRDARRTGVGPQVRVVEQDVCLSANYGQYHEEVKFEESTRFTDYSRKGSTPNRPFQHKPFGPDDWTTISVGGGRWNELAKGMGRPDLLKDPRFTTLADRVKNIQLINELVSEWMARYTKQEAMAILAEAGVLNSAVNTIKELSELDHVRASGMMSTVETKDGSSVGMLGWPIRLSGSPVPLRRGPALGEHNDEVEALLAQPPATSSGNGVEPSSTAGPLRDILIADFTVGLAGPTVTRGLERLGARVIKIERPDNSSRQPNIIEGGTATNEIEWALNQGGKQSIKVDLRTPEGKEVVRRLVAKADVVVENFSPGTMEKLGFGYDVCRQLNPEVIFASGKGFNPGSPWEGYGAVDPIGQAASGGSSITGAPERSPVRPSPPWCDTGLGVSLQTGINAALMQREMTGKGQQIFVSMVDAGMSYLRPVVSEYFATGVEPKRNGNLDPNPLRKTFCDTIPCEGGKTNDWCVLEIDTDEEWRALIKVTGLTELADDPRFATCELRYENAGTLRGELGIWSMTRPKREVMRELVQGGVKAAAVLTPYDFMHDQSLWGPTTFSDLELTNCATAKCVAWPVSFSSYYQPLRQGPGWGQHTDEVLGQLLGYTEDEIAALRKSAVI